MTWGAPLAWLGLLTLAVPVLVHLLARHTRKRLAFPTLRFIDPSRLTPVRRRQLTDPLLLAVRLAVLLAAVAALAQPRWPTASRESAAAARIARAIVVDTSPSMAADTPDGRTGVAAARDAASRLSDGADAARVREVTDVAAGLAEAAAWLAARGGRRELVVISDFQRGTLDAADVGLLDPTFGLRLERVDPAPPGGAVAFDLGERRATASTRADDGDVVITWDTDTPTDASGPPDALRLEAPPADMQALQRLRTSARRLSQSPVAGGPVTVVLPGAPERPTLLATARGIDVGWMFDVVDAIRRDQAVRDAARSRPAMASDEDSASPLVTVLATADQRALVGAGATDVDGTDRLLLVLNVGAGHPLTAAVLAATPAPQAAAEPAEADPVRLTAETLAGWSRESTAVAATAVDLEGASDGRWFWLAALLLLGLEAWLRRQQPTSTSSAEPEREERHAHVA